MSLINDIIRTMDTELDRILLCLDYVTEEQIWYRFKSEMNSIGNLCVHLAGNEYQHFVSGIGNTPNIRQRSFEFTADHEFTKEELKALLKHTRNESKKSFSKLRRKIS